MDSHFIHPALLQEPAGDQARCLTCERRCELAAPPAVSTAPAVLTNNSPHEAEGSLSVERLGTRAGILRFFLARSLDSRGDLRAG